jgi:hypothetical protein
MTGKALAMPWDSEKGRADLSWRAHGPTTMLSRPSQPIITSSSRAAAEGLLAQLLHQEHLVADPHLVLDARAQRIFVVEPPIRTFSASDAWPRKRRYSGRTTRWPSWKPGGMRSAANSAAAWPQASLPVTAEATGRTLTSPMNSETNFVRGGVDLLGRSHLHQLAVAHDADAVAHHHGLLEAVGDVDEGLAGLAWMSLSSFSSVLRSL